jgi:hypothetical protein
VICTAVIPLYRQSCAAAAIYQTRDIIMSSRPDGYLSPAAEVDVPLFNTAARTWLPDAYPAQGASLPAAWSWGVDAADRAVLVMLRALRHTGGRDELRQSLTGELQRIAAIRQAVDKHLTTTGPDVSLTDETILQLLDDTYTALGVDAELALIVGRAATLYAKTHLGDAARAPDVLAAALAIEVSNGTGSLPSGSPRPIFQFARLGLDDPPPLLKQEYDKQLAGPDGQANDILYGTRLNHFAAFADESWRAWDWMWGRMNALAYLASLLGLSGSELNNLTSAVLEAEGCQLPEVLENIGKVLHADTRDLLKELREKDRIPPVFDALFEFISSDAPTFPPLPHELIKVGQIASHLLARNPSEHDHGLSRDLAALPRHLLWKRIEPAG